MNSEYFSTDTLRYFYSSIFQGYAAIFTLSSMFYIYYSEKIDNTRKELEDKALKFIKEIGLYPIHYEDIIYLRVSGIFKYIEKKYINSENFKKLKSRPEFKYLEGMYIANLIRINHTVQIKSKLKIIVALSILILLCSLICLYFIGFNNSNDVNNIIFCLGIRFLIVSVIYFILLGKLVFQCIGLFHSTPSNESKMKKRS